MKTSVPETASAVFGPGAKTAVTTALSPGRSDHACSGAALNEGSEPGARYGACTKHALRPDELIVLCRRWVPPGATGPKSTAPGLACSVQVSTGGGPASTSG